MSYLLFFLIIIVCGVLGGYALSKWQNRKDDIRRSLETPF